MKSFGKVAGLAFVMALCVAGFASATTLAVNAGSALNGTNFGMQLTQTAVATDAYVRTDHPINETHYLMRFWIDPSNMPIPEGNAGTNHIRFFRVNDNADNGDADPRGTFIVGFLTKSPSDHQPHMIFWVKQNGTSAFTSVGNLFLGAGASQIEVEFTAANSGSQSLVMKKLGTAQVITKTNLNLSLADVDFADFGGFPNSNPAGVVGSYKFDEFESYR